MSDGYPETPNRPIEEAGDAPAPDGGKCLSCNAPTLVGVGCPNCN